MEELLTDVIELSGTNSPLDSEIIISLFSNEAIQDLGPPPNT